MPDGSVRTVRIPPGVRDPVRWIRRLYPGGIIAGVDDGRLKNNPAVKPFVCPPRIISKRLAGRDITAQLKKGLATLEAKFKALSVANQFRIAKSLYKIPRAFVEWDILTFTGDNPQKFGIVKQSDGYRNNDIAGNTIEQFTVVNNTATINGESHHLTYVNYILWGRINRLLRDTNINVQTERAPIVGEKVTEKLVLDTIRDYRRVFKLGFVKGPVAWAKVGWRWTGSDKDFNYASSVQLKDVVPNRKKYKGGLAWRVHPRTIATISNDGVRGLIDFLE